MVNRKSSLYIRTDMNEIIATGHLMRCLSIADAARRFDIEVVFILADNNAAEILDDKKFKYIILNSVWNELDDEIEKISNIIKKKNVKKLLIDTYSVTPNYLNKISDMTDVIYIDDCNDWKKTVSKILCYSNYYERLGYSLKENDQTLYLGYKYVPLRKEFSEVIRPEPKEEIKTVLITSGGSDPFHIMEKIIDCLLSRKQYEIIAICGKYDTSESILKRKYSNMKNVQILKNVDDIIKYMNNADLAISAGGTTLYELCACGVPTISYAFVDNQLLNIEQFEIDELIDSLGDIRDGNFEKKLCCLMGKYESKTFRKKRSLDMQNAIDGKGAERLIMSLYAQSNLIVEEK